MNRDTATVVVMVEVWCGGCRCQVLGGGRENEGRSVWWHVYHDRVSDSCEYFTETFSPFFSASLFCFVLVTVQMSFFTMSRDIFILSAKLNLTCGVEGGGGRLVCCLTGVFILLFLRQCIYSEE